MSLSKYNKFYIGLAKDGRPYNFAVLRPKKNNMQAEIKLPHSEELDTIIEENQLDDMGYNKRYGNYRIRLTKGEIQEKKEVLKDLLTKAEELFR